MPILETIGLGEDLGVLREKGLKRSLLELAAVSGASVRVGPRILLNFGSNDYLGLGRHPETSKAAAVALKKWGTGSGASRLLSGSLGIHHDLERALARFKGEESALVFSSGYLANLGAVTSLVDEKDLVLVDRLAHASLVDAARLSRAKFWVYPHNDVDALAKLLERGSGYRRRLVLTETYFSMDGDVAPLDRLVELCRTRRAMLLIDEAHSTGVFGKTGRGLTERFGLQGRIDVVMGTLSKALGSVGGFLSGKAVLRETLIHRCRTFIYTTAPSPAASGAALKALELVVKRPALRAKLWANVERLRGKLVSEGFDLMGSEGPIVPIRVGEPKKALAWREELLAQGFYAGVVRPPTVPKGTDRVRVSVTAAHSSGDIDALCRALQKARDRRS